MNPIIDVTLEKGKTSLFTKKFRYENTVDDNEIKFQVQLVIISIVWKVELYPHKTFLKFLPSTITY